MCTRLGYVCLYKMFACIRPVLIVSSQQTARVPDLTLSRALTLPMALRTTTCT